MDVLRWDEANRDLRERQRRDWDRIAASVRDFHAAPSTQYYRRCEIALLERSVGSLRGKRVLKLDLWNEAFNTRILDWMREQGAEAVGLDIAYMALVTLKNTNGGQTQFISPGLTRFLRFLLYPLYAVPQVFSVFPRRAVTAQSGDLLVMRGARALHRGITLSDEGERILIAYTFDSPDKKPNPLRDWIARRLNY